MTTAGTISLREETFEALLTDIAHSFKMHGFQNIILIGDSGGNVTGMKNVADKLNAQWNGNPVVAHIPEHYAYNTVAKLLDELGVTKAGHEERQPARRPGHHDEHDGHRPEVRALGAARQSRQSDHQRRLDRRQGENARDRQARSSTCAPPTPSPRSARRSRTRESRRPNSDPFRFAQAGPQPAHGTPSCRRAALIRRRRAPTLPIPRAGRGSAGRTDPASRPARACPTEFGPGQERRLENRAAVRPLFARADARPHLPDGGARRAPRHHLPRSPHGQDPRGSAKRRERASKSSTRGTAPPGRRRRPTAPTSTCSSPTSGCSPTT